MKSLMTSMMRRMHGIMFKMPMMIACDEFEAFILAYLEDDLSPRQKRIFEIHLMACRECREYLRAYNMSRELARSALDADIVKPGGPVPDNLVAAIVAAREV